MQVKDKQNDKEKDKGKDGQEKEKSKGFFKSKGFLKSKKESTTDADQGGSKQPLGKGGKKSQNTAACCGIF